MQKKIRREKKQVETENNADQIVYQIEKTLGELGDKATEEEKAGVQAKIEELKKIKDGDDVEAIKDATEE